MKTKSRRFLSLFLSLLMMLPVIPMGTVPAFAATSGDFEYSVISEKDKTCEITSYTGSASQLTIPSQLGNYEVTSIGESAFFDCTSLTSITIPNSVTSIGIIAFYGCASLTSVTIPESVNSMGGNAFNDTGYYYNEDNWERGVLYIGNYLLGAKETVSGDYKIKQGTKTIADGAFSCCISLTSITIPDGVTSIGGGAFEGCTALTSIEIPNSVTSIEDYTFYDCTSLTSITIPDGVTSIGYQAFSNCTSLADVTIPESVTSIRYMAFENCPSVNIYNDGTGFSNSDFDLSYLGADKINVIISDGVTNIASNAFYLCDSLTSVEIPDSITSIGERAFSGCDSLASIIIPESVMNIGENVFEGCNELTIYGYNDSFAQAYAQENDIPFNALGDIGGDGIIDANDYAMVRSCVMCQSALTEEQRIAADYNRDGVVDAFDALEVDVYLNTQA